MTKKTSTVARGNYYLNKTIKFFKEEGYECEKLEKLTGTWIGDRMIWKKNDLLYSDMLAYGNGEFILIQVKGGSKVNFNSAVKNYGKLQKKLPSCIKLMVVVWRPRVRMPEVIEI